MKSSDALRIYPKFNEISEMSHKNQSPFCRSAKRKKCLAESDRPKQFEDTQGSGKNKKLFQFQNNFLKEPDEKVKKWPIEALPQDGALLKPRDE